MLVLVGIVIQMSQDGHLSPTALFFYFVAGTFLLAAILHPQEEEQKIIKEDQSESDNKVAVLLSRLKTEGRTKGFKMGLEGICSCICCPKPGISEENTRLDVIVHKLEHLSTKVDSLERCTQYQKPLPSPKPTVTKRYPKRVSYDGDTIAEDEIVSSEVIMRQPKPTIVLPDSSLNEGYVQNLDCMRWLEDPSLGNGKMEHLPAAESFFFQDLIHRYLYPLDKDKVKEEQAAQGLLELRNKMSFAYFLVNMIWAVTIFVLQMNTDQISIPWPFGNNLRLEPLGFIFLVFFGLVMILQTLGMIMHRTSTFLHIIASTSYGWFKKPNIGDSPEGIEACIELAKTMGALNKDEPTEAESSIHTQHEVDLPESDAEIMRRKTVRHTMVHPKHRKSTVAPHLDDAFAEKLGQLESELANPSNTIEDINQNVFGKTKSRHMAKSVRALTVIRKTVRRPGNMQNSKVKQLTSELQKNTESNLGKKGQESRMDKPTSHSAHMADSELGYEDVYDTVELGRAADGQSVDRCISIPADTATEPEYESIPDRTALTDLGNNMQLRDTRPHSSSQL